LIYECLDGLALLKDNWEDAQYTATTLHDPIYSTASKSWVSNQSPVYFLAFHKGL